MSSLKYWVWLSSLNGVGAVAAKALLDRFGTPEKVFEAAASDYADVGGINKASIKDLTRKDTGPANKTLASCAELGYRVMTLQDADYPDRLRNIYDPPIVLYVRGNLPMIDEEAAVAVVGSRNCTPYGISAAEDTGYKLAAHGLVVVTGLARGIDTAAARGALRAGGRVIGVIGSGVDVIYPPENKGLFDDVASSGAVLSEYPPGTPAVPGHFPSRNRILSGLSLGVAVIEAPKKSGALITATRALEHGRDVFALPGNINARSCEGSNALLREGAIPFLSADDIIDEYIELFPDKIRRVDDMQDGGPQQPSRNPPAAPPATDRPPGLAQSPEAGGAATMKDAGQNDEKKVVDNKPEVEYIDLDKVLSALDGDERAVAEAIGRETLHIDEIIASARLPAQQVLTALTMLEIKGRAARGSGQYYSLTHTL